MRTKDRLKELKKVDIMLTYLYAGNDFISKDGYTYAMDEDFNIFTKCMTYDSRADIKVETEEFIKMFQPDLTHTTLIWMFNEVSKEYQEKIKFTNAANAVLN